MAEEEEAPKKEKKKKKVVRRRKTTKEKENPIMSAIRLTVESGKVDFGARRGSRTKAKLFVIAQNAPRGVREPLIKHAESIKAPVIEFKGTTMQLGAVCGKPFPVSVLSVYDEGNSNIMKLAKTMVG
jgi:large subunit ribosomal protein L30e